MSKRLSVSRGTVRYASLSDYIEGTGKRKNFVARHELDIDPPHLSRLLKPEIWKPQLDDTLVSKIAKLLNRPDAYVRDYYRKAAA